MSGYVAADGTRFTDEDVLRWAEDVENGFADSEVNPTASRAWEVEAEPMVSLTVRVPAVMVDRVREVQKRRGSNVSQFVRAAIAGELQRVDHA